MESLCFQGNQRCCSRGHPGGGNYPGVPLAPRLGALGGAIGAAFASRLSFAPGVPKLGDLLTLSRG